MGKKMWFGRCLTVVMTVLAGGLTGVLQAEGLRVSYDAGGAPVDLLRDGKGTVQVDGLPYPGLVLYRPDSGVVYYQHPDLPEWLSVAPEQGPQVRPVVTAGAAWQPWQGLSTRRFDVQPPKTERTATGEDSCAPWFASTEAAKQAGMDARDLMRIINVLEWLNGGSQTSGCLQLSLTPAQGMQMGLPVNFTSPGGVWQLNELVRTGQADIPLPETTRPIDDRTRLQLLLGQFGAEERQAFVKAYGNLPLVQQVRAIEGALSGAVSP